MGYSTLFQVHNTPTRLKAQVYQENLGTVIILSYFQVLLSFRVCLLKG